MAANVPDTASGASLMAGILNLSTKAPAAIPIRSGPAGRPVCHPPGKHKRHAVSMSSWFHTVLRSAGLLAGYSAVTRRAW